MVFGTEETPSNGSIYWLFLQQGACNVTTQFMSYVPLLYNTIMVGHMGNVKKLDGVGLSSSFLCMFIGSIMLGLNRAQDHLTSTAFGVGDLRLCGVYLNRGRAIFFAVMVPLLIFFYFISEHLIRLVTDDDEVVAYGMLYFRGMLIPQFLGGNIDLQKKWLLRMRIVHIPMYSNALICMFHIPAVYIAIFVLDLDIPGLCYATGISAVTVYLILLL